MMQSIDKIGNYIYKLIDIIFENNHNYWKFIYINYSRLHTLISLGHINIKKCELEQALK